MGCRLLAKQIFRSYPYRPIFRIDILEMLYTYVIYMIYCMCRHGLLIYVTLPYNYRPSKKV